MKKEYALLQKWDYESHTYKPFYSPAGHEVMLTGDPDIICRCAECGKKMRYGDGYTSIRIHDKYGFGYAVCRNCSRKEWEERRRLEGKR